MAEPLAGLPPLTAMRWLLRKHPILTGVALGLILAAAALITFDHLIHNDFLFLRDGD